MSKRQRHGVKPQGGGQSAKPSFASSDSIDAPRAPAGKWLDRCLPIAIATLFFILVWTFHPFHVVSEFDPDEGNNVIKALMMSKGHRLYTEIWSDQPPLFTYMLRAWFAVAGWSAHQARIFVLLCSSILLWALYQTIRPTWGHAGALIGVGLLATSWRYVSLSVSAMLAIPTLMLAMLSAYFLVRYRQQRRGAWLMLSGAWLALSLFTKLFALPLAPLLLAAVVFMAWSKRGEPGRAGHWLRPVGCWLAGFAITAVLCFLAFVPWSQVEQLIRPHLDARSRMGSDQFDAVFAEQLRADGLYALFGLVGLVQVVRRREWLSIVPIAWYGLAVLALSRHRPIWYHHYLLLSVPMCWMAGAALGPALSLGAWRKLWPARSAGTVVGLLAGATTLVMLAVVVTQIPKKLKRETDYAAGYVRMTPRDDYLVAVMRQFADNTHYVFTDRQMLAFRAGLLVPPELSVTSMKRTGSGHLTIPVIMNTLEKYRPEQVVLSFRHQQRLRPTNEFREYLNSRYQLIYRDAAGDLLYVHPGLADNAGAALEAALNQVPQSEDGWYNWGLRMTEERRDPDAVTALQRSIDIRPSREAYNALAESFERLGKKDDAADARQRASRFRR